jgi:hypothetical protein
MRKAKSVKNRVSADEVVSLEEKVSRVETLKKAGSTWRARDLLNLFGVFMRDEHRKKLKPVHIGPRKDHGQHVVKLEEKYIRAFLRVVQEETYKDYEPQLLMVYVNLKMDPFAVERCSEFEIKLDASLDKTGFTGAGPEDAQEAQDALDGLIPITTCALALGVHRATLHRWIEAGLKDEVINGMFRAVEFKGNRGYVNFMAALAWKEEHHQPKKRTRLGTRKSKKVA